MRIFYKKNTNLGTEESQRTHNLSTIGCKKSEQMKKTVLIPTQILVKFRILRKTRKLLKAFRYRIVHKGKGLNGIKFFIGKTDC